MYDLVADDRKNFLRPDPAKSQSRRMGEWELADLKIRDTLVYGSSTIELVHATIKNVGLPTRGRGEFAPNLGFVNWRQTYSTAFLVDLNSTRLTI
jgi:hypothetical protein